MNPILGIDLGKVRIGVAISDQLQLLAHPLETIPGTVNAPARISAIVRERNIDRVVVGVPRRMNGAIGEAAQSALDFADKLRAMLACDVVTWDERLTSAAANRALRDAGKKTRQSRAYIDQVAAQMILQSYLDSRRQSAHAQHMPRR